MIVDIPVAIPEQPVRLIDQYRSFIRSLNMSYRTEQVYVHWLLRYIRFHQKRHPATMGAVELEQFLTHLAVQLNVAINTQRTALNALIFFYNKFLNMPITGLEPTRAKRHRRIPVVFSPQEARAVIEHLSQPYKLAAQLMYGAGLRITECLSLRVKDVDFSSQQIIVRSGKGGKDRRSMLPESLIESLRKQIAIVEHMLAMDKAAGIGDVYMPNRLAEKYPRAGSSLAWQFIFPSTSTAIDPRSGIERRHHLYDGTLQRKVKEAIILAKIFSLQHSVIFLFLMGQLFEATQRHCPYVPVCAVGHEDKLLAVYLQCF